MTEDARRHLVALGRELDRPDRPSPCPGRLGKGRSLSEHGMVLSIRDALVLTARYQGRWNFDGVEPGLGQGGHQVANLYREDSGCLAA
jgi:hypothetical protein